MTEPDGTPRGETTGSLIQNELLINVLGVVYVHKKTSDGGDLYLTKFGLEHAGLLEVENWYEKDWFRTRRERLEGTSAVYRVPTKEVRGRKLDLVVKNCRVGEDVPLETRTLLEFINAEFNSPWEEFALVMEMRDGRHGPEDIHIQTQQPLAIYVPPEKMQIWQSGRSQEKINRIRARHPGIDLDVLRQYKLIYRWIRGKNAVAVLCDIGIEGQDLQARLAPITAKATSDMEAKGYAVIDMKPAHIIIGEAEIQEIEQASAGPQAREQQAACLGSLVEAGQYSVVDYELLIRTPAHEQAVKSSRRHSYLDDQRDRFKQTPLPSHLRATEVFGVPYVFGHAESTGGALWVVGRNPRLFDYFLPERWRKTHSWRLSEINEVSYTFTKDSVHIVWKTSRVGEKTLPGKEEEWRAAAEERGFNSPFEEFAVCRDLTDKGVPCVYVRAIYMTGSRKMESSPDLRRYETHRHLLDPDGNPILRTDRNYITIRGYYNGSDGAVAEAHGRLCRPVDVSKAALRGLIDAASLGKIRDATLARVRNAGYDGSLLRPNDLILVLAPGGELHRDAEGLPEARVCNFELIRPI